MKTFVNLEKLSSDNWILREEGGKVEKSANPSLAGLEHVHYDYFLPQFANMMAETKSSEVERN